MRCEICTIVDNYRVATDTYKMVIESKSIVFEASAGQFVHIRVGGEYDPLLRRPISICEFDKEKGYLTLLYRVCGKGTKLFVNTRPGDSLDIMGPLGKGFPVFNTELTRPKSSMDSANTQRGLNLPLSEVSFNDKKVAVIGGGIGIAPLLELCKNLNKPDIYLGFRDETYMVDEFSEHAGTFYLYTEDGKEGCKGYPIEALAKNINNYEVVYACGPKIMLSKTKNLCEANSVECYLSMEEKMGCGIGACLVCACKSAQDDLYKKVCVDGPVFNSKEVKFND
ncbi:MAG: dihydroorotate dehydrogenase electron transfer subunit [Lutispora sp.]|nr:dihydroorotate dehydrogenase electron transfer subunit [Lutispora sp.]